MRCAAPAWRMELKSFYCLKINQTSKHKTWWRTGEKKVQGMCCTLCSSAASIFSRIDLRFCLLTIWAETFDYIPWENWQIRGVLELFWSSATRGKVRCSSWAGWRRLLPAASLTWTRKALSQVPTLKQHCTQLTGCQHSQNSVQSLSQSRNILEGARKMLQCCNPGKSQSTAHLFCLALHRALKAAVCSVMTA